MSFILQQESCLTFGAPTWVKISAATKQLTRLIFTEEQEMKP